MEKELQEEKALSPETSSRTLIPEPPYVWPESRVLQGIGSYLYEVPFEELAQSSDALFGIISSPTRRGLDVLKDWINKNSSLSIRLLVAVYPTGDTSQEDLSILRSLAGQYSDCLEIRVAACRNMTDRPTNGLCFFHKKTGHSYLAIGPSENLGFDDKDHLKLNFVFRADTALVESFKRSFTWFWGRSKTITAEGITLIPRLYIPEGSAEAALRWQQYIAVFSQHDEVRVEEPVVWVDPETGEVRLKATDGEEIQSPTEEIGIPKLDSLAERIARLYEKGSLVSIDKLSRIPPLDAPVDPRWFNESAEVHHGNVSRKVQMRCSIIDDDVLKAIETRRRAIRDLMNKFTFRLADTMNWMPDSARSLFEAQIKRVNSEGQKLIADLLKGNVEAFVDARRDGLRKDINAMYKALGGHEEVPKDVIDRVVQRLKERLTKAQSGNFMPKLTFSKVSFETAENMWASPWGQAYSLLSEIARFPREALTKPFFLSGMDICEDDLIDAMNAAEDQLAKWRFTRGTKERCKSELALLSRIKESSVDSHMKCDLVVRLLSGETADVQQILDEKEQNE